VVDVTVRPESFSYVEFDAETIRDLAAKLIGEVGLDVQQVIVEVDETNPLGRAEITDTDPLTLRFESGAFEDPKRPRHMSPGGVADVLGRLLFQYRDRIDPAFGAPEADDDDIDLPYLVAWQVYAVARLARLGYRSQRQRRLYHFRNRCGFTDASDAAFDALWTGEDLTWADLTALVDGALAAREPTPA
jgi:hypothetical protein